MSAGTEFLEFPAVLENPHVKAWKSAGKPVIGFYCSSIPEEIVHAAGALPFRMRGTGNVDFNKADAILSRFNCTFVRSTLNLFMNGAYDFLDGMVSCNSCDQTRRMYDIWGKKLGWSKPLFFLSFPHTISKEGRAWVRDEYQQFQAQLGQKLGTDIMNEVLEASCKIYARNTALMNQVHDLLASDPPRITGTEFLRIAVANGSVRKEFANEQLEGLIPQIQDKDPLSLPRARLMVAGSFVDNPDFLQILEHAGAIVVSQNLCSTEKSYDAPGQQGSASRSSRASDALEYLITKYYEERTCPRMMNDFPHRLAVVTEKIKDMKVDGVILQRIEFCDLHGNENMLLQAALKELDIPTLNIDREYFLGDTGRLRTRVEAFLEKLGK